MERVDPYVGASSDHGCVFQRAGSSTCRFAGAPHCKRLSKRITRNSRPSVFDGDNVCLDLAVDRPPPEALGDSFRDDVGCFAKPRGVARLDLVP